MDYTLLMCKNKPVYNIDTEEVYNFNLLPGLMQRNPCTLTFKLWFSLRYSSNTNTIARHLKGITFGQGRRPRINKETHAFSLSDSYWIRQTDDNISFEQYSTYYNNFWTGNGPYSGGPIPTLYVGGYLTKEWINSRILCKYGKESLKEFECASLCKICNIKSVNIQIMSEKGPGILIENITNPNLMLEQADQSGKIDPEDFDEYTIEKLFGSDGIDMIIIDTIVGNGDRHAGNFGWLRSTDTGEYICMAPLYDFDHAFDSIRESDRLITDTIKIIKTNQIYINRAIQICNTTIKSNINSIFSSRAKTIIRNLV